MSAPTAISCAAAPGSGGLGRHVAELVDAARSAGQLEQWWTSAPASSDAIGVPIGRATTFVGRTPVRAVAGLATLVGNVSFDRAVARAIDRRLTSFAAFTGQALHSMRAARVHGTEAVGVVAASTHADGLARCYARAHEQHPIERTWLSSALRARMIREYAVADVIHVASEHTRQTFLAAGIADSALVRHCLTPAPRFYGVDRSPSDRFEIVYVGAISVAKGSPVLLEAFARLRDPNARLTLVGGWSSRAMRHYVEAAVAADSRIQVTAGDPLPHLRTANVLVHPSWGDGFGYAPAEAMAMGLPVIVTDQTGMSELITDGHDGWIVAAGDASAIVERLCHMIATT